MRYLVDDEKVRGIFLVGDDRAVSVDDPEHCSRRRLGTHGTLDNDVSITEVRAHGTASYLRRVCRNV